VPVTPNETLGVVVGGLGDSSASFAGPGGTGGFGGGGGAADYTGGGGGASDVISGAGTALIVAGGGGGAGDTGGGAGGTPAGGDGGYSPGSGGLANGTGGVGAFAGGGGGGVVIGGSGYRSGGNGDGVSGGGGAGSYGASTAGGDGGTGSGTGGPGTDFGAAGGPGTPPGGNGGIGSGSIGGGGGGGGIGFGGGGGGFGGGGGGYGAGGAGDNSGGGGSSFVVSAAKNVSYASNTGDGSVTITYDPIANSCATGTVTAMNQSYTAAEGVPITEPSASLELGSSDTDPNPSAQCCDAALVSAPANGTAVVDPDGGFTYTPDAGFSGHDSFTFSLTDTDGNVSAPATVTITVLAHCNVATWPVSGTFPVAPQDAKGLYIGQDGGTFTIFSAHPGSSDMRFTGTVTIAPAKNGVRFSNSIPLKLEDVPPNVDTLTLTGEQTLGFTFNTEESLDGISFHPSCNSTITFSLKINGVSATTKKIFLGSAKSHPATSPFSLHR